MLSYQYQAVIFNFLINQSLFINLIDVRSYTSSHVQRVRGLSPALILYTIHMSKLPIHASQGTTRLTSRTMHKERVESNRYDLDE